MSRFVNDDYKVKKGGRKAVRVTVEELYEKIKEKIKKMCKEEDEDFDEAYFEEDFYLNTSIGILLSDDIITKDIKYLIDTENIDTDGTYMDIDSISTGESYLGIHTLSNGLTFLGTVMGGDWEIPAIVIYYYDGKNIRAYVPTYGNTVNVDFKTAFGSEFDSYVDCQKVYNKYVKEKRVELTDELTGNYERDSDIIDFTEIYLKKYETNEEDVKINWDAIIEEITARIEILD